MSALRGSRLVVLGGGSGIGKAVERLAAAEGAEVVIAGRDAAKLDAAARGIPGALARPVDARDETALGAFFGGLGGFDHLVVTVGPGAPSARYNGFLDQPTAVAESLFANKFWSHYRAVKQAAPHLRAEGSITLFAGGNARRPVPNMAVLAAVHAAIEGMVRGLALDLAPLRINAVSPGRIASESFDALPDAERKAMFDSWAARLPVRRIGRPEDAAAAALFLMQNRYCTGSTVYVDGGHFIA